MWVMRYLYKLQSTCASPSYLKEAGDLISRLPDDILQLILSYLPTRLAIKTSVLSRRWRHVWSDTWSLSFHRDRPDAPCINRILDRYRAPKMMSFRICSCCRAACISRPDTHAFFNLRTPLWNPHRVQLFLFSSLNQCKPKPKSILI